MQVYDKWLNYRAASRKQYLITAVGMAVIGGIV
jgi:hypothetical protein